MPGKFKYYKNESGVVQEADKAARILPSWKETEETWLFLSAHDDDIVAGAGLLLAAAIEEGINSHAVITSDGRMGYCSLDQRETISDVRQKETVRSFEIMGLPATKVHFMGFPDGNLNAYVGRRAACPGDLGAFAGYTGLENAYVHAIRQIKPTRVIMPTSADLHPDHKISNMEMQISLIHACGEIWPELGKPIDDLPTVYEYATYSDFPETPTLKIVTDSSLMEKKMNSIRAYASQKQIEAAVQLLQQAGPVEYIRELNFRRYNPANYEGIF